MPETSRASTIRVLIVEDSKTFAFLLTDILGPGGESPYEPVLVPNLGQARRELAKAQFDVILLDLNLPDSQGVNTLSAVKAAAPSTPVVVLTGLVDDSLERELGRLGATDILFKDEMHPRLLPRVLRFAIERHQQSQLLLARERNQRRIIERARDAIYRTDGEGRFTFLNPAAETITGYQADELLGKSFRDLIAPEHRDRVTAHYFEQIHTGIPTTYLEFPIHGKDGEELWIGQHVWLAEEDDASKGIEAIARDITGLHRDMESLERSRHMLEERVRERTRQLEKAKQAWERTFDAVADMVMITDTTGKIARVNRAAAQRTGMRAGDLVGQSCGQVVPGLDAICVLPSENKGLGEYSQQVRDEERDLDFLVSSSPLAGEEGAISGYVHVARDISPLKQAERTVKEQVRFLQVLIQAIPNPVFFKDKDGTYTDCNAAFLEFTGLTMRDFHGQEVHALLPPEQDELIARKDQELMQAGGTHSYEMHVDIPGRGPRDIIQHKAVARSADGEMDGLVGVIVDITDLRVAERALRASEEQFRSLFEQAPISLWEEDFSRLKRHLDQLAASGMDDLAAYLDRNPEEIRKCASMIKVVNVNAHTLKLFQANSKEELITKLSTVLSDDSLPAFREELLALHRGESSVALTAVNNTLRHKKLHFLLNLSLAPGSEDTWERVLVSIQDLTERLEAESALRDSEKRYRALVETLNEGMIQVDESARIVFLNQQFADMIGYPPEELVGTPLASLLNLDNARKMEEQFSLRKQGGRDKYELSLQAKSGQTVDVQVSPRPIFDDNGVFRGSYSLITDITDRKKLEFQLRQSQKMEAIGQLAAGIAHEINTPTQYVASNSRFLQEGFADLSRLRDAIDGFLETLRDQPDLAEKLAALDELSREIDTEFLLEEIPQALEANIEGLDRIATIVRSMKEFAHPGQEDKQPVDLNQIITSTVTVARNEWKYVAEVETDLDPKLPLVTCVSNEIKQVILNIVVNAAQAIGELVAEGAEDKGRIWITSRTEGPQVKITVADTGPGIPPELTERVFDPFFTTKEPGKGTGQGLAIAYRVVVDNHGGTLHVSSKPGQGTVFEIRLPQKEQAR